MEKDELSFEDLEKVTGGDTAVQIISNYQLYRPEDVVKAAEVIMADSGKYGSELVQYAANVKESLTVSRHR